MIQEVETFERRQCEDGRMASLYEYTDLDSLNEALRKVLPLLSKPQATYTFVRSDIGNPDPAKRPGYIGAIWSEK